MIEPHFEKKFIYDSHACRANKGTLCAISRLRKFLRKITTNSSTPAYYGQFDIQSFFTNINKNILLKILCEEIKQSSSVNNFKNLIWLTKTIIKHDPTKNYYYQGDQALIAKIPPHKTLFNTNPDQGLPIGK